MRLFTRFGNSNIYLGVLLYSYIVGKNINKKEGNK